MTNKEQWKDEMVIIGDSLPAWNANVLHWMRGEDFMLQDARKDPYVLHEYKVFAHQEARRRGWKYEGDPKTGEYVVAEPISAEDFKSAQKELARQQKSRRTKDKIFPTRVPHVNAFWECLHTDESGVLIIQDMRKKDYKEYAFDNVPEKFYDRLFASDAKETLANILTMFKNTPFDEMDWLLNTFDFS